MKKDIIAAITFLVTAVLFYAVQSDGKAGELFSQGSECEMHGAVLVKGTAPKADSPLILDSRIIRDS